MNNPHDDPEPLSPAEKELLRSLRLLGELAPEAANEVNSAEEVWDDLTEEELPESLRDAIALAGSIASEASKVVEMPIEDSNADAHLEVELARVARQGTKISEEVERRMAQDRAHAKEQSQNG